MRPYHLCFLAILLQTFSIAAIAQDCSSPVKYCNYHTDYFPYKLSFSHSSTIKNVSYHLTYVDFTITSNVTGSPFVSFPQTVFKYRLVRCGCSSIQAPKDREIVYTKPAGVYIPEGPTLGLLKALIPNLYPLKFSGNADFIFSPVARRRIATGKTVPISSFDLSPLANAERFGVSLLGTYGVGSYVAAETGKPFITIGEVSEKTVLGRAEYIKLLGLLFQRERTARRKFWFVKRRYNRLLYLVKSSPTTQKPSVFFNYPFPPTWTQPSEFQYITSVLLDAGADYLFKDDGMLLGRSLNFEDTVSLFKDDDVLVNSAFFPYSNNATLEEFVKSGGDEVESTLLQLNAVSKGSVWSNSKRISPNRQANDFFEGAAFRADLLLRDYIRIVRPDLKVRAPFVYMYNYAK